jgi:tetratricopeptide (TPR) repeat protein
MTMSFDSQSQFETLKSRLQQDPDSLLFARVADGLLDREQLDEAIRICEDGIRKHPYYVTGHMVLGKCYLKKKLFDLAEKEFKRVILFDPKYIAAHKYYGDLMREVGWDNTCEMSYRKILNIDPLDKNAREVLETLERIKPKEQKVVTPEHPAREVVDVDDIISPTPVEDANVEVKPKTQPINIDDDLFAGVDTEKESEKEAIKKEDEKDENIITTILEDIFDDDEEKESTEIEEEAKHDTIDELNIKISPRPSPKEDELPDQEEQEKDVSETIEGFEEDTIEFSEMTDIGSETTEHLKSAKDFDIDFIAGKTDVENEKESDESFIDTLEVDNDDIFGQIDVTDDEEIKSSIENALQDEEFSSQDSGDFEFESEHSQANAMNEERLEPAEVEESLSEESAGFEREKIVTPTLGEIYAAQGQYAKAIHVFELLAKKDPTNSNFMEKISFLKKKMEE